MRAVPVGWGAKGQGQWVSGEGGEESETVSPDNSGIFLQAKERNRSWRECRVKRLFFCLIYFILVFLREVT